MGETVAVKPRFAMSLFKNRILILSLGCVLLSAPFVAAQKNDEKQRVRSVSIPISIFTKSELEQGQTEELLQVDRLIVNENLVEQEILSIRSRTDVPLSLAILIQDDLTSDFNIHIRDLAKFVEQLPRGTRVMVAYMRAGSLDVRQKFTDDLAKAAKSFRIVFGTASAAPRSPFESVSDALNRFDALPSGRRAILMASNGLDLSNGSSSPSQSNELQGAIRKAQRKNVAVYEIFSPAASGDGVSLAVLNGQASLSILAEETGGRLFNSLSSTPVNINPFLQKLNVLIGRQFLLTYISQNMKKGYYKVEVKSTNPEVKIEHPKGYYYR